jgi:hypothetical protein
MNIVWRTLWFAFKGVNELYVVCETSNVISISAHSRVVLNQKLCELWVANDLYVRRAVTCSKESFEGFLEEIYKRRFNKKSTLCTFTTGLG